MGDLGSILNVTRSAILSHLSALNVTSSNIANVDTEGYTRLRATFGSTGVVNLAAGQEDFNVQITSIERLYNKYLEEQVVGQEQNVGYTDSQTDALNRAETIFNESTDSGINNLLAQFWSAWSEVSANPSGTTERDNLVSISQSLASMFRQKANELISVQNDTNTSISDAVTELNQSLDDMVDLNNKIAEIESGGGSAMDLRDKRTELLRDISQIIDVNYYEEANGSLNIFISNGRSLVEGSNAWKLDVVRNTSNNNYYDIVFQDTPAVSINDDIKGGKLAGLLDVRDTKVTGYLTDLDNMAATVITNVNAQHSSGYDLNGNIGGDFFSSASTRAKDMRVDSAIVADVTKIAASATVNSDGDNASLIAAIQDDSTLMGGGAQTIDNFYESLVSRIGQDVADLKSSQDHQTAVMTQMESAREAVSGVSLDEEMLNIIKYQAGYNAAARLSAIVNEMMDTLINLGE
ncbi:MAG: flagellar hook-associated protein FlgK [Syntrophaceae bacterium]